MFIPFMENGNANTDPNTYTLREYAIDFETGELTGGIVEGKEAVKVWIYKALKTTRYVHDIYSWDYGHDLDNLIGKDYDKGFVNSEVERIITDTLTIHPNIKRCYDFTVTFNGDCISVIFTVDTDFGEVTVNV